MTNNCRLCLKFVVAELAGVEEAVIQDPVHLILGQGGADKVAARADKVVVHS